MIIQFYLLVPTILHSPQLLLELQGKMNTYKCMALSVTSLSLLILMIEEEDETVFHVL